MEEEDVDDDVDDDDDDENDVVFVVLALLEGWLFTLSPAFLD